MANDDRSSDDRLRQTAHATLIRFEAEVDGEEAMTEFRRRVTVAQVHGTGVIRGDRARDTRRVWAIAAATTLVVGGIAALAWPDKRLQLATSSPDPVDTTAGSMPITQTPANTTSPATEVPTTSAQASSAPRELVALFGHTWVITAVDGQQRPYVAHFEMAAGRITGGDGCNRYGGDFQVTAIIDGETSIELGEVESTAMGCPAFPDEQWWSAPNGRYRVDGIELTITATDGRIFSAVDLEALEMINAPEQIVGVWTVRGGVSIEFADDGTIRLPCAAIGTWTFDEGLRTEIDETADTSGCGDIGPESLGPTYEALVSTSPVIRIHPDGSLLVEASAFGRLFPSTTSVDEAPDVTAADPAAVDMLAVWPAPPAVVPDLALVPLLLPAEPVVDMSNAVRLEAADSALTSFDYAQVWTSGTGGTQLLVINTNLAQHSSLPPVDGLIDIGSWDAAAFVASGPDVVELQLDDPSGFVDIRGVGLSRQHVVDLAASLTIRDGGQPGWTLSDPDGSLTVVHEGWTLGTAQRQLTWSTGSTVVELNILWGAPQLVVPGTAGARTVSFDIHDTPAIGYTAGSTAAGIAWSPSPDVTVRVGAFGLTLDDLATIATSVRAVDEATWNAASEPDLSPRDGCQSIFC